MEPSRTSELPEDVHRSLPRLAGQTGQALEKLAVDMLAEAIRECDADPVLQLSGCLESEAADIAERHDQYISRTLSGPPPWATHPNG